MEIIVSHPGTDFDALAAMAACARLHPGAKILLTGTQLPAVRQFIALHKDSLRLYRREQLNLDKIDRLYIVDAPGCQRLGDAAWSQIAHLEPPLLLRLDPDGTVTDLVLPVSESDVDSALRAWSAQPAH